MAAVSKSEWGTKRNCLGCGTKFYDLGRNPITCPSCGALFEPVAAAKGRRQRNIAPAVKPEEPPPEKIEPAEGTGTDEADDADIADVKAIETDDAEEDDDVIEDPSELGEDEDDVAEVIVGIGEKEES